MYPLTGPDPLVNGFVEVEDDGTCIGRTFMDAPDIDNSVIFTGRPGTVPGDFATVRITDAFDYDLSGEEI